MDINSQELNIEKKDNVYGEVVLENEGSSDNINLYRNMSFKETLKRKIEKYPNACVCIEDGKSYTYDQLNKCSQILARDMEKVGIKKGTHVGLLTRNCFNGIVAFAAMQKLGAVTCLLNFNHSPEEIANLSDIGDITHLCYGELEGAVKNKQKFLEKIQDEPNNKIISSIDVSKSVNFIDRINAEYYDLERLYDEKVHASDVCTMVFSYGSPDEIRGILLTATNMLDTAIALKEKLSITNEDKICMLLPLFHVIGFTAFFSVVLQNGVAVMIPNKLAPNVLKVVEQNGCTLLHTVPSMFQAIINNKDFTSEKVKTVRGSILLGDTPTKVQYMKIKDAFPNTNFMSIYGISEIAPICLTEYKDTLEHITTTCGKPIGSNKIMIRNKKTHEECDINEVGEVFVEQTQILYNKHQDQFVDVNVGVSGWFNTKDIGFLDKDGYLHLTERRREAILRGGEIIVPDDVEKVLLQYEDIKEAYVLGIPDEFYGEIVGASVVLKEGKILDIETLMRFTSRKLSKSKIPALIMQYEKFPVLPDGEVDHTTIKKDMRKRLAELSY